MALTATNKADLRFYLGYSMRFHNSDTRLEQAMSAVDTDPDAEVLVLANLVEVKEIDTKLKATHSRLQATKVCKISLAHTKEICALRSEGRRFVGRIASTLGVPVRHDAFSSSLPTNRASHYGMVPGSNNGYRHG